MVNHIYEQFVALSYFASSSAGFIFIPQNFSLFYILVLLD